MPLTVNVGQFSATLRDVGNGGQTRVLESSNTNRQKLRYESRFYTVDATATCTNTDPTAWYIGFVQSCHELRNEAYYLDHATKWTANMPVCDCCGTHPWYSTGRPNSYSVLGQQGKGRVQIPGNAANFQCQLSMNDNLCANVPWYDPVPFGAVGANFPNPAVGSGGQYPVELSQVWREQRFQGYLAATPAAGGPWQIYKTVIWNLQINVRFDRQKPLGQRVKFITGETSSYVRVWEPSPNDQLPACLTANACIPMNTTQTFDGYGKDMNRFMTQLSQNY